MELDNCVSKREYVTRANDEHGSDVIFVKGTQGADRWHMIVESPFGGVTHTVLTGPQYRKVVLKRR